jgi:hypothetical protein
MVGLQPLSRTMYVTPAARDFKIEVVTPSVMLQRMRK